MKYYGLKLETNKLIKYLKMFKEKSRKEFKQYINGIMVESCSVETKFHTIYKEDEDDVYLTMYNVYENFSQELEFEIGIVAENKEIALEKALKVWENDYDRIKEEVISHLKRTLSELETAIKWYKRKGEYVMAKKTKKEGLIEFYKENHKEGDLFCIIHKRIYDSMEKNTIEVSMFENLTGLEDLLVAYNDDLFYKTDTCLPDVEYIYNEIIDCYFSTKEQEDYKEKYILNIKK